jgi:hypothetical protein
MSSTHPHPLAHRRDTTDDGLKRSSGVMRSAENWPHVPPFTHGTPLIFHTDIGLFLGLCQMSPGTPNL